MSHAGIEFRKVTKRYGDKKSPLTVKGIDFTIPKGTLTTILGPSGCGKTTTLRMIAGLEASTSGEILIDGKNVTTLGAAERNVSMVFQSYALFPHMSVLENVSYGLDVSNVDEKKALQTVGLTDLDARFPAELSGGQQQRVALARALVLEPSVLLFDEPLSNLDARLRRSMREEIRLLQQRLGLTVAYVTHDQSEALAVSDQIIVMNAGTIAQAGSPQDLYERPQSEFVAGFMGEAMLFDGQSMADGTVHVGTLQIQPKHRMKPGPIKAAIRPEAWELDTSSAKGGLQGTVSKQAYLGSFQELSIATVLGQIFVVCAETSRSWVTGDPVTLRLNGRGVSIVPA
jgi:iron(III) transport system ATP-binding protein